MRVVVSTAPASEPVTLTEAKAALRVEHSADDTRITALITTAREAAEKASGRSFVNRTYTATFAAWEMRGGFVLPYGPVGSITSFNTYDATGTATLVTTSDYQLAGDFIGQHPDGGYWITERAHDSGVVVYVAGFGATAASVPESVKDWIKAKVRALYQGEGMTEEEEELLSPFVSYQYG